MNQNLKDTERELVKLVNFFRRRAEKLMAEGRLSDEHQQVSAACDKLINGIYQHAENRTNVLNQREQLKNITKDNAVCPKCNSNNHLKHTGIDSHEQGWKSNTYKCRKCNITFTWNRPNNPWDMVPYMEGFIKDLQEKIDGAEDDDEMKEQTQQMLTQLQDNLDKLKPVIENSDRDYAEMELRDAEMDKIIKEFKTYLLIEKVKMDAMEN